MHNDYGAFQEEEFYLHPSYGKIEYNGKHFYILKSKVKKENYYPVSLLHNPLKGRLRYLNLINKYYKQNDRHLNIGLGIGDYELFLTALPIKLYSVEHPNGQTLKKEITQKNIAISKTQLSAVDICILALPFDDNFFDSISFLEVLEHLPVEKLHFVISEITRVLKKGGYVYMSTPNLASLENRLLLMFKGKLFLYIPESQEVVFSHLRTYAIKEIREFFERFHYKILEEIFFTDNLTWKAKGNPFQALQGYLIKFLINLNKNFNNSIILVLQKT